MFLTRPAAQTRDDGFTLIELLIVITILAVISVPLADAVILFLRNTDATTQRMALSHDAQITGVYFARDVAASGVRDYSGAMDADGDVPFGSSVQLNAAYDAGGEVCGTSATPRAAIRFLADDWSTATNPPTVSTDIVGYYLETSGKVRALHRISCVGTTTTDTVVAHYVDPTTLTITCASTCAATPPPQQVTMTFSVTQPHADPYQITVTGQRRQT